MGFSILNNLYVFTNPFLNKKLYEYFKKKKKEKILKLYNGRRDKHSLCGRRCQSDFHCYYTLALYGIVGGSQTTYAEKEQNSTLVKLQVSLLPQRIPRQKVSTTTSSTVTKLLQLVVVFKSRKYKRGKYSDCLKFQSLVQKVLRQRIHQCQAMVVCQQMENLQKSAKTQILRNNS